MQRFGLKLFLRLLFAAIFIAMVLVTVRAGHAQSLWDTWPTYAANPWAVATLWDAYCGFITFYVWVCFRERSIGSRFAWFVLIMGLGNIAMSFYVLIQLFRLRDDEPVSAILAPRP